MLTSIKNLKNCLWPQVFRGTLNTFTQVYDCDVI